jgi:hypothetical protein
MMRAVMSFGRCSRSAGESGGFVRAGARTVLIIHFAFWLMAAAGAALAERLLADATFLARPNAAGEPASLVYRAMLYANYRNSTIREVHRRTRR